MTKTQQSIKQSEVDAESCPARCESFVTMPVRSTCKAAEAAEEGKPSLRKFSMVAYTGGAMRLGGWPYPVVVDLGRHASDSQVAPNSQGPRSRKYRWSHRRHHGRRFETGSRRRDLGCGQHSSGSHRHQRERFPLASVARCERRQGCIHSRGQNRHRQQSRVQRSCLHRT